MEPASPDAGGAWEGHGKEGNGSSATLLHGVTMHHADSFLMSSMSWLTSARHLSKDRSSVLREREERGDSREHAEHREEQGSGDEDQLDYAALDSVILLRILDTLHAKMSGPPSSSCAEVPMLLLLRGFSPRITILCFPRKVIEGARRIMVVRRKRISGHATCCEQGHCPAHFPCMH